jgi:hypothetical protein
MNNDDNHFLSTLKDRKIFIYLGPYDFRCSVDTLAAIAATINLSEFHNGSLFAFCSKSHIHIRVVFWQGCGSWMISRKVAGRFKWPNKNSSKDSVLSCYKDLINLLSDPIPSNEIKRRNTVDKLSK